MNRPGEVPMRVHKALKRFEYAVEKRAFKGAQHPENHPAIEKEYAHSKENLLAKIRQATALKVPALKVPAA